ncbi:MAG: hypothetical protein GWN71_40700, partial [Gammaproteobacteria bacterium]|nr:hypothetical protein [Gemmatimonadota bacterium]NIR36817.1 hypothetical protein [Actinomycetota bacterium]NIU79636.1 hypothetical protein [Gammaproteobacteria bacterium]NIY12648.1 hypothetical protein [Gemmatimonadota bacterium]
MRLRTGGLLRAALRSEPGRTGLAVLGIAVSAFLVMALLAAYRGIAAGVVAYTGQQAVDLWVAPMGTDNLIRSSGLLSGRETRRIRNTTGVRASGAVL